MSTQTGTSKGQYSLVISGGDQELCKPNSTLLDPERVYSIHQQGSLVLVTSTPRKFPWLPQIFSRKNKEEADILYSVNSRHSILGRYFKHYGHPDVSLVGPSSTTSGGYTKNTVSEIPLQDGPQATKTSIDLYDPNRIRAAADANCTSVSTVVDGGSGAVYRKINRPPAFRWPKYIVPRKSLKDQQGWQKVEPDDE